MPTCIFCGSSDYVKLIGGNKGICSGCAEKLAKYLKNAEGERPEIEAQIDELRKKCDANIYIASK